MSATKPKDGMQRVKVYVTVEMTLDVKTFTDPNEVVTNMSLAFTPDDDESEVIESQVTKWSLGNV